MNEIAAKLWDAVWNLGFFGGPVFFALYWREGLRAARSETKADKAQEALVDLVREVVESSKDAAGAINRMADHNEEVRAGIAKLAEGVTILSVRRPR